MVSKQSVLVISVLDAREMGRYKDLSKFDKGHIVMTGSKYLWNIKVCGFLPVSRGDNLPTVARGGTNHKLATKGPSMHEANKGYPIWFEPSVEGLLWHKSLEILMSAVLTAHRGQTSY